MFFLPLGCWELEEKVTRDSERGSGGADGIIDPSQLDPRELWSPRIHLRGGRECVHVCARAYNVHNVPACVSIVRRRWVLHHSQCLKIERNSCRGVRTNISSEGCDTQQLSNDSYV